MSQSSSALIQSVGGSCLPAAAVSLQLNPMIQYQSLLKEKSMEQRLYANVAGKTVELPTNVDAELLAKVLSNPEMAALLSTLAKSLESK